ncbi:TPA: SprT-like domain-containing protein [Pseudomonas aeruginosa]|uniref:SprT-like domain-containing protein n=1 Tax=Pseudomonas aeruginosa TaxID=287 RepID=UPI003647A699|nr:SprT-like domain-containing protein [Pseudomonas aeruginosa]
MQYKGNLRPTEEAYQELQLAYDFYNRHLFGGQLPTCLLTFQREKSTLGYFSPRRFIRVDGTVTDEIALNPAFFAVIPLMEILQTIGHEMAHLWQFHFGTPSRAGYHNAEWAAKMESIGLMPSDTGAPGGRRTGQKMGDYVIKGGLFERCTKDELLPSGFSVSWLDRFPMAAGGALPAPAEPLALISHEPEGQESDAVATLDLPSPISPTAYQPASSVLALDLAPQPIGERSNRAKYICPRCGLAVWGKGGLKLGCLDCDLPLEAGSGKPRTVRGISAATSNRISFK